MITRAISFVALLCLALPALAVERDRLLKSDWRLFESAHFTLVTNTPEKRAAELISALELFRAVVLDLMELPPVEERLPTRVVIFSRTGEFNRIAKEPLLLGYMRPSLRGNRMVAAGGSMSVDQQHILFHEYVHHLMRSGAPSKLPTWYDEGLADFLASAQRRRDKVLIGAPIKVRMRSIYQGITRVSLARVVNNDDISDWHPSQLGYFYGISWGLVNYLITQRPQELDAYLGYTRDGIARPEAFEQAFGTSPRAMERRVLKFLDKLRRPRFSVPLDRFEVDDAYTVAPMNDRDVSYELAFLALFSNPELSRKLLTEELFRSPADLRLISAIGITYQAEDAWEVGVPLAREAWLADPDDAVLGIDYADMLMVWNDEVCEEEVTQACAARTRTAVDVYRRALAAEPDNPEVHSGLSWALEKAETDLEQALGHINVALDYQPWASYLLLRRGQIQRGLGRLVPARADIERALYWAEDADLREEAAQALEKLEAEERM